MYIYIICPVRNQSEDQKVKIDEYVSQLEKENDIVFWPYRDAPQDSLTGFEIVECELEAIKLCDEVHLFWDVNSKGSHFDLGMAYALNKKIKIFYEFQEDCSGKSYIKAIREYNKINERLINV